MLLTRPDRSGHFDDDAKAIQACGDFRARSGAGVRYQYLDARLLVTQADRRADHAREGEQAVVMGREHLVDGLRRRTLLSVALRAGTSRDDRGQNERPDAQGRLTKMVDPLLLPSGSWFDPERYT